jgi:hypothetical protein
MANDSPYFRLRAEAELQRTEASRDPRAAEAHAGLARRYLEAIPSRARDVRQAGLGTPSFNHAVHDEWTVRMATAISREHRGFAADYVRTRIETAHALGQARSVEAWRSVLERLEHVALSHEN